MKRVLLCLLALLNTSIGAGVNPTGIVVSRKPALIETTNSADNPMPTSTKPFKNPTKTVEAPSPTEDAEETVEPTETTAGSPRPTANPKAPDSEIATPTNPSSPTDPTDYSTVWPTRWRPRRRFGAQSEAPPQFNPNWKLIVVILISAILL